MKQGSHNFLVIIIFTNELPKGTNFDQWRYMLEVVFDKSPPPYWMNFNCTSGHLKTSLPHEDKKH